MKKIIKKLPKFLQEKPSIFIEKDTCNDFRVLIKLNKEGAVILYGTLKGKRVKFNDYYKLIVGDIDDNLGISEYGFCEMMSSIEVDVPFNTTEKNFYRILEKTAEIYQIIKKESEWKKLI